MLPQLYRDRKQGILPVPLIPVLHGAASNNRIAPGNAAYAASKAFARSVYSIFEAIPVKRN